MDLAKKLRMLGMCTHRSLGFRDEHWRVLWGAVTSESSCLLSQTNYGRELGAAIAQQNGNYVGKY